MKTRIETIVQPDVFHYTLSSLEATEELACTVASLSTIEDVITLQGDLGVGKTAFSKAFINYFFDKPVEVLSPTFTLVQTYESDLAEVEGITGDEPLTLWHFDLYRLESRHEILELGIEEALSEGISIIEWPEIIADLLPDDRLEISLFHGDQPDVRIAEIKPRGNWLERFQASTPFML